MNLGMFYDLKDENENNLGFIYSINNDLEIKVSIGSYI